MKEKNGLIWQETEDGGIRLLRVSGNDPIVQIPNQIEGKTVTEIGAYCFAREGHWKNETFCSNEVWNEEFELAGKEVEQIFLPDTVKRIGRCAFYNCTQLQELGIGKNTVEYDSDAFLNCKCLHSVSLHGSIKEKSGIRQMLAQVTWDVTIQFIPEKEVEAVLFYPEYREYYDEIGPAHIFCMNIEGEGFRLRKAFQDEKVDVSLYDDAFSKASAEESAQALQTLALWRLRYPVELSDLARSQYEVYLKEQQKSLLFRLLKQRDLESIQFLVEQNLCEDSLFLELISQAVAQGWTEGVAKFMHMRQETKRETRYSFDL